MMLSFIYAVLCGTTLALPRAVSRSVTPYRRAEKVDLALFEASSFGRVSYKDAKAAPVSETTGSDARKNITATALATAGSCTTPRVRHEWRDMDDAHKIEFVTAIRCLMDRPSASSSSYPGSKSRYEDLVSVHQQMVGSIHMVAQFLPWHRFYLHIFESLLRNECAYNGTIPWWDEVKDAGRFSSAPLFTSAYFGSAPLKTPDGKGTCVGDGVFRDTILHIGPGSGLTDHCLSRAVDESLTSQCNGDFLSLCNSHATYSDMETCAELGPHAYGHDGLGAVMADVASSPGDPVFFLHHTFVDHAWYLWQNADSSGRLYQVNGNATTTEPRENLVLTRVLPFLGLVPDVTVNDAMDTLSGPLCYAYSY